jgi:D-alanyl-D-alanine carboxypeptidase (penicillin-binding protein 5/6)
MPVSRSQTRPRGRWIGLGIGAAIVVATGTYLPLSLLAPLPSAEVTITADPPPATTAVAYNLPESGYSAFGFRDDTELVASQGADQAYPIASITKIITALVVLEKYPLAAGEQGPSIRMGRQDLAFYEDY